MLNNKGMTLVELLVTFSLLLVIVVGMFNLIMEVKFDLDDKQLAKDFTEYSSTINDDIHYDLLKNKPFAIAYRTSSADNWVCKTSSLSVSDCESGGSGFVFNKDELRIGKSYEELNTKCSNIFPCAIYAYTMSGQIYFNEIALNKGGANTSSDVTVNDQLKKHGIKYNGVFESIPNQDFVEIRDEKYIVSDDDNTLESGGVSHEYAFNIELTNDNLFIIDFPYFLMGDNKNYGFKIVYPFAAIR